MTKQRWIPVRRVLITGAGGNLGRKLVSGLLATEWYDDIVALDLQHDVPSADPRVRQIASDLAQAYDPAWRGMVREVDAIVHLAAQNPRMWCTWGDAAASFDMTARLAVAAGKASVRRFVFASSNHVMGGYKESELAAQPGALTEHLAPSVGTRTVVDGAPVVSTAYAAAKLMGERMLAATASPASFTAVSLRIGWCQRGENRPETISGSGASGKGRGETEDAASLRWFRGMWLSDRDWIGFVHAALQADPSGWPAPAVVVNAVSANAGSAWDLTPARDHLGLEPQDDLSRHVVT